MAIAFTRTGRPCPSAREGLKLRFEHGDRARLIVASCLTVAALPFLLNEGKTQRAERPPTVAAVAPGGDAERDAERSGVMQTEVFPLTLFATGGLMLFPAASDLITLFIALEVLSLPLYVLCGTARRRRLLSQEAAVKYFLLGAFSSAFFAYGVALVYGFAGSMQFADINEAVRNDTGNQTLLLIGMVASLLPAQSASSVEPMEALRED